MSRWIARCALLGTALATSPTSGGEPVGAEPADLKPVAQVPAAERPPRETSKSDGMKLSPEDLELLEWLDLLEDIELLESWDPSENLPIPSSAVHEPPEDSP